MKLSAEQLSQIYELVPRQVRQYLEAEIQFVLGHIMPASLGLEPGCCVLMTLAWDSGGSFASLLAVGAAELGFRDKYFVLVVCIQNG
jgi:hypothetical protein